MKIIYSCLKNHDCDLCLGPLDNVSKYVLVTINDKDLELHKECSDISIKQVDGKYKFCSTTELIENIKDRTNSSSLLNNVIEAYNNSF